jgi:hypothetical protein
VHKAITIPHILKMKFKSLKYGNIFVDGNKLHSGIYEALVPDIYFATSTLDGLAELVRESLGESEMSKTWIENISKCHLVDIELTEVKTHSHDTGNKG